MSLQLPLPCPHLSLTPSPSSHGLLVTFITFTSCQHCKDRDFSALFIAVSPDLEVSGPQGILNMYVESTEG